MQEEIKSQSEDVTKFKQTLMGPGAEPKGKLLGYKYDPKTKSMVPDYGEGIPQVNAGLTWDDMVKANPSLVKVKNPTPVEHAKHESIDQTPGIKLNAPVIKPK